LSDICKDLTQNDPDIQRRNRWDMMIRSIASTQVMSAQLWFKGDLKELGFDRAAWGLGEKDCAPNVVTYANPVFSWLDQTQFLELENWSSDRRPKMVAAFTNSMPDPAVIPPYSYHFFDKEQYQRVRETMRQWIWDHMGWFFPKTSSIACPQGVNWNFLMTDDEKESAMAKFDFQFFKAAVHPSDRYILAVPGTAKWRMKPDHSGYSNMKLVGDWTDFGANFGYMEGTVISAIQAVTALRKQYGWESLRVPYFAGDIV
jgi:hypothetical protein